MTSRRLFHPLAALRRFARARRGATAVEFAIVAGPFLMLLFGIMELGLIFMVATTLEHATDVTARQIRTGEFQTSGATSKENFKERMCGNMSWLAGSCGENLAVDVRTFEDFTSLSDEQGQAFDPDAACWYPGEAGDVVLVRTYYTWTIFTPLLNAALVNGPGGTRMLNAAATFRNEPFSDSQPTGARCN